MNATILTGDVLDKLRTLPDASVQCVITSPPYYGLRDYGTAKWDGGDAGCDHKADRSNGIASSTLNGGKKTTNHQQEGYRQVCAKCGARRIDNQIGLEPTPAAYVARMVEVFREVRRVLREDGVCWLNLGDSYNGSGGAGGDYNAGGLKDGQPRYPGRNIDTLKPKDLIGIPWRVAFALQEDGWWLRSDIIWAKPNPMPESVTDRPTKSHEYVFLLTKSARYFYDAEAVKEAATYAGKIVTLGEKSLSRGQANGAGIKASGNGCADSVIVASGRNARTVWTIATQPYPEAHFATFPEELPRRCILAGSKGGDTVLDPFAGSGTTLAVALQLGRNAIGIELNPEYVKLAQRRLAGVTPALFGV